MFLFAGFTLLIFAPFELYLSGISDFWFSIYDFAGYLIAAFAIYALCCIAVVRISKRLKKSIAFFGYLCFLIVFAMYIQGNFVIVNYGELDGNPIDWSRFHAEGFISVAIFLAINLIGLSIVLVVKNKEQVYKVTEIIAVCLILMQVVTLVTLIIRSNGLDDKRGYVVTNDGETDYSSEENIIVVVLDTYDARVFDDLYNDEYRDEIEDVYRDFAWYRNTTCNYRLTDFSLHEILTGQLFLNRSTYGDYLIDSYASSELIKDLEQKDYDIGLYISTPIPQAQVAERIANWKFCPMEVSSHKRLLEHLFKLVGFRYTVQPLKKYFWTYTGEIDDLKVVEYDGDGEIALHSWGNDVFINSIKDITCNGSKPKFSVLHMRGVHAPRRFDSNLNYSEEEVSIWESARGMNRMMSMYLDRLKELGIYDNSTIVIMGDHGAVDYDESGFGQSPLLMIKRRSSNGDFSIIDTPISYDRMQDILISLVDDPETDADLDLSRFSSIGPRYHYETEWAGPLSSNERAKEFVEYEMTGDSFDTDRIVATGKKY